MTKPGSVPFFTAPCNAIDGDEPEDQFAPSSSCRSENTTSAATGTVDRSTLLWISVKTDSKLNPGLKTRVRGDTASIIGAVIETGNNARRLDHGGIVMKFLLHLAIIISREESSNPLRRRASPQVPNWNEDRSERRIFECCSCCCCF